MKMELPPLRKVVEATLRITSTDVPNNELNASVCRNYTAYQ